MVWGFGYESIWLILFQFIVGKDFMMNFHYTIFYLIETTENYFNSSSICRRHLKRWKWIANVGCLWKNVLSFMTCVLFIKLWLRNILHIFTTKWGIAEIHNVNLRHRNLLFCPQHRNRSSRGVSDTMWSNLITRFQMNAKSSHC